MSWIAQLRYWTLFVIIVLSLRTVVAAKEPARAATRESDAASLCARWLATDGELGSAYDHAHSTLLDQLTKSPAGDSYLLKVAIDHCYKHDGYWGAAREKLGELNTTRTFVALVAKLKDTDPWQRINAIELLERYDRPDVFPLMVQMLESDADHFARSVAARALGRRGDARAEEPLLNALGQDDKWIAIAAAEALGTMNAPSGYEPAWRLYRETTGDLKRAAIEAVGAFHTKIAVVALLDEYDRLVSAGNPESATIRECVHLQLRRYASVMSVAGPETDAIEAWRAWWSLNEPLVTDALIRKPDRPPLKGKL
jgi:hypothetical protein